ncbi:hypothetical protein [Metamycoplasma hyosynoviae]|uniref:hypothetical protein n=1 Tax=Metamycoplasma hyosynoviae TaxID=29559 RepID=UPI00235E26C7|nr:hypothetical protein [Metamycoplasma hyosynoviae]MDD1371877.1 hypothetical protein [Metamycoplasma hyosynoviae]
MIDFIALYLAEDSLVTKETNFPTIQAVDWFLISFHTSDRLRIALLSLSTLFLITSIIEAIAENNVAAAVAAKAKGVDIPPIQAIAYKDAAKRPEATVAALKAIEVFLKLSIFFN